MYKAYKFRLYPNDKQKELIHKTFGCTRFIYNYFLNECKENEYQKAYDMCNKLKELLIEYPFLKEVDSCSLRNSIFNLEDSYKNFFEKRSNYPKFKSKFNKQSYRTTCIRSSYKGNGYSNIEIDLKNRKIKLPKLGLVDIRGYRNLYNINGKIINVTVEKETTNKYYVSVIVEEVEVINKKKNPTSIVGIDLGIKDLVVTSNGEKYTNPKEIKKHEKRLKRLQKKLSRQIRESNNYYKTKLRISRLHSKIKNSRRHNLIEIVNRIVKEHDIIISEKLKVKEMSSNHNLAKQILDASFNKICNLLKWKAKLEGKYYYQVDAYYPSSKICSHCGNKTKKTSNLSIRKWECINCGYENDRDINASINIMFEGLKIHYQN
ncbi:MAG: transposase [Bacilli bacterium]|nr:transposase [Bacilli bacterium]